MNGEPEPDNFRVHMMDGQHGTEKVPQSISDHDDDDVSSLDWGLSNILC